MATEDEDPRLDTLADAAVIHHVRSRSILCLEAAISCLLDGYDAREVAEILRQHAEHLEDHG
jgi:hypothetical protein